MDNEQINSINKIVKPKIRPNSSRDIVDIFSKDLKHVRMRNISEMKIYTKKINEGNKTEILNDIKMLIKNSYLWSMGNSIDINDGIVLALLDIYEYPGNY